MENNGVLSTTLNKNIFIVERGRNPNTVENKITAEN